MEMTANFSPYVSMNGNPVFNTDRLGDYVDVKTTKYYKDKNGDLHEKKWYNVFKKTALIEKNITMYNAKLYDYNSGTQDIQSVAKAMKSTLESKLSGTDYIEGKLKGYDSNGFEDYEHKKEIKVTFKVEGEIEIINDLNSVNSSGSKPDNLFIYTNKDQVNKWFYGPKTTNSNVNGITTVGEALSIIYSISSLPDEMMHQSGVHGHGDGGVQDRAPINYNNLKKLHPQNLSYTNNPIFNLIKN